MKNNLLIIQILFFQILFLKLAIGQNQSPNWGWPVKTDHLTSQKGKVVGTPGEYRGPYSTGTGAPAFDPFPGLGAFVIAQGEPPRYHGGVDITSPNAGATDCTNSNTEVYHIGNTGTIHYHNASNDFNDIILVDQTIYWHTVIGTSLIDGVSLINRNDQIGTMANVTGEHVHIMPWNSNLSNHLLILPGFSDNSNPTIEANRTGIYKSGTGALQINQETTVTNLNSSVLNTNISINSIQHALIYGAVDMIADIDDEIGRAHV